MHISHILLSEKAQAIQSPIWPDLSQKPAEESFYQNSFQSLN